MECIAYVVAPLAGAWIEIGASAEDFREVMVAPLAGAWIEMKTAWPVSRSPWWSPPSRGAWIEIGSDLLISAVTQIVAPLAGA